MHVSASICTRIVHTIIHTGMGLTAATIQGLARLHPAVLLITPILLLPSLFIPLFAFDRLNFGLFISISIIKNT